MDKHEIVSYNSTTSTQKIMYGMNELQHDS